ncbi:helicase-related protein [Candidatus Poriferisocius sp.]|uniref:helicase-related protein n=1 Tax=Candidatus Poriferisocius sp. TaxID=3101276 RepID=UPI003B5A4D0A
MRDQGGGGLFIVDNSESGWTGLEYLRQWTEIARSFDIATGFFEIGALLAMEGTWQQLDKIRILMGDEVSLRTRQAFKEALQDKQQRLDDSLENEKSPNPFLDGVGAVVEALESGRIECRVYRREKFHAKAYITHAKFDVVGAQALVGSSNFTRPGLTQNVELNIQIQSGQEVAQLQEWFDAHWEQAEDVTEEVLRTITRHTAEFSPFDIYAKALHEFFRGRELTAGQWDQTDSRMFGHLDQYQKEAYWSLMKIARQHGGAFLCDGVGLGKTFVGLMLVERLVMHENKRVVIFAPKAAKEGVWEPHLRRWLPHIGGIGGNADFSNLTLFSHTDLTRTGEFPERFERIAELADAVIIDEAHHFRNRGSRGEHGNEDGRDRRSRYWRLYDLLNKKGRTKQLFMLTATPVNNRLADFRHLVELFSQGDEAYFGPSLGVHNLTDHFSVMERHLQESIGDATRALPEGYGPEVRDALSGDEIFEALVVQRSRAYAKASQVQERGESSAFPQRQPPQVAAYSMVSAYREILNHCEGAFERGDPLFTLAIYYPLAYYIGPDSDIDPLEKNRQCQVVGLIRTMILKRFESSAYAFEKSLKRLLHKLLAFLEVHSKTDEEVNRFEEWKRDHARVIHHRPEEQFGPEGEAIDADDTADDQNPEEDLIPREMLDAAADQELSRDEYDVPEILQSVYDDLYLMVVLLKCSQRFTPAEDDKLEQLTRLLTSEELSGRKVLVFTEFADTARYVARHLRQRGISGLAQIDGSSEVNRAEAIRQFSPYYNGASSADLAADGLTETRVLVSTDVLSEGLNLQDADRLVNYDIHWNPVRLMQRIGRVDRRMDPEVEARIATDHPETAHDRGTVQYWNFLPPEELDRLLALYERVTHKALLISKTLGIEGEKLLTPDDDYDPLREFNTAYEGTRTPVEDLHLEYQKLLKQYPHLADRLDRFPSSVFSGRRRASNGARGVFLCYSLPALDTQQTAFTLEAGPTRWYLWDLHLDQVIEAPGDIATSIRSTPSTPRHCTMKKSSLVDIRTQILAHIRNTYLKQVNAPLDAPKPKLLCWMEMN